MNDKQKEPCQLCSGKVKKGENVCAGCVSVCEDIKNNLIQTAVATADGNPAPSSMRLVAILTKMNIQFRVFEQVEMLQLEAEESDDD